MLSELLSIGFLALFTAVTWVRFPWGTLLLAAFLPTYVLHLSLFGIPTTFFEIAVLILLVIGLGKDHLWQRSKKSIQTLPRVFIYSVLLFFMAVVASVMRVPVRTSDFYHALGIVKGWIVVPALAAWVIALYNHTEKNRKDVIRSMAFSGVVIVLYGLLQNGLFERLKSFYDVPNSVALFLVPLIVILLWQGELVEYLLAAFLFVGLLATQSVGGILAVAITLFLGLLMWRRRVLSPLFILYTFVVLCFIGGYFTMTGRVLYLIQTFSAAANTSWNVRLQLWSVATTLVAQHPLLGVGLGQFEGAYQAVLHQRFFAYEQLKTSTHEPLREFVFRDPHNFILSFWLNTGLVGLVAWLGIPASAVMGMAKKQWPPSRQRQAVLLGLLATLLFGLVDTIYWKNDLATQWWVFVLLLF